jgi:hypothetical protein
MVGEAAVTDLAGEAEDTLLSVVVVMDSAVLVFVASIININSLLHALA